MLPIRVWNGIVDESEAAGDAPTKAAVANAPNAIAAARKRRMRLLFLRLSVVVGDGRGDRLDGERPRCCEKLAPWISAPSPRATRRGGAAATPNRWPRTTSRTAR